MKQSVHRLSLDIQRWSRRLNNRLSLCRTAVDTIANSSHHCLHRYLQYKLYPQLPVRMFDQLTGHQMALARIREYLRQLLKICRFTRRSAPVSLLLHARFQIRRCLLHLHHWRLFSSAQDHVLVVITNVGHRYPRRCGAHYRRCTQG